MLEATQSAFQQFEEKQEKQRLSFEMFLEANEDLIGEIHDKIQLLKKLADNYDGYDFTEEMEEFIKDLA